MRLGSQREPDRLESRVRRFALTHNSGPETLDDLLPLGCIVVCAESP